MIKMSKELKEWIETFKSLGNQDNSMEQLLEGLREVLRNMYKFEIISEDEFLNMDMEIEDILLDNDLDFIVVAL